MHECAGACARRLTVCVCAVRGTGGGRRVWGGRGVEAWEAWVGGWGGGCGWVGGAYAWGREARGNIQHVFATAGLHGGTRRVLAEHHACAQTHTRTDPRTDESSRARTRSRAISEDRTHSRARTAHRQSRACLGAGEQHARHHRLQRQLRHAHACGPVPVRIYIAGASPVPVRMWEGRAQSRCRCGRGEPSPGADIYIRGEPSPL